MKNYLYIIIVIALFTGCRTTNIKSDSTKSLVVNKTEVSKEVHVVLLAGQSNMAGAGNFDALSLTEIDRIEKISSRVSLSFNGKKAIPLSSFKNKLSEKYNFVRRFGPEIFIGLTLAEKHPNQDYLLIKRSQGGTALYGAWNSKWTTEKAKAVEKGKKQNLKLFNMHIANIKNNLQFLESQKQSYKIIGLAWMQGENDAAREISAITYKDNLKTLIKSYRDELRIKNMPFVIGQINSKYGKFRNQGPAIVRKAMEDIAISDDYVDIIKTSTDTSWSDFPKYSDNVHYNAEGQKRLGEQFGLKIIRLNK